MAFGKRFFEAAHTTEASQIAEGRQQSNPEQVRSRLMSASKATRDSDDSDSLLGSSSRALDRTVWAIV